MAATYAYSARGGAPSRLLSLVLSEPVREFALAFAMLLPLLFINQLWTVGAALFIFVALTYFYLHRQDLAGAYLRRWPLMLAPAFFLFSVLWSDYPMTTLKQALMVGVTMGAGFALSASRHPGAVIGGFFAAFSIFMAASVAFGDWVTAGGFGGYSGEVVFGGLNGRKNLMGATAAMSILVTIAALIYSLKGRATLGVLAAVATLGLSVYALVASKSAGAIVSVTLGLAAFGVLALFTRMRRTARLLSVGFLGLLVLLVAAFARPLNQALTETVLRVFQKDATFTGRSYIWYRAQDFIAERPLLGRGFGAFWIQDNPDAEGLWRFGQITERMGFSFHNTLVELLVHLGWAGAILLIAIFLVAFVLLLRKAILAPDLAVCFFVSFLVYQLALSPFESTGAPAPFDVGNIIFMTAIGYGFRKFGERRRISGYRIPAPPPGYAMIVRPSPGDPRPVIVHGHGAHPGLRLNGGRA